jgi:vancomycin resistance protein YoaR
MSRTSAHVPALAAATPNRPAIAAPTAATALLLVGAALVGYAGFAPPPEVEIAGYATRLEGRTPNQRHNARLAATSLDGSVIAPGAVFSFNRVVRSWSADEGYRKAPVSYNGELVPAFGGGVCQTSTTLYDAALLAGLTVVERHHHVFAPHYVPPGCDAAVAYPSIDLRLRNPYPYPLRIRASADGDQLVVRVLGRRLPNASIAVVPQVLDVYRPARITLVDSAHLGARNPGMVGFRVITWRVLHRAGQPDRREELSDDTYPAMDRIVPTAGG